VQDALDGTLGCGAAKRPPAARKTETELTRMESEGSERGCRVEACGRLREASPDCVDHGDFGARVGQVLEHGHVGAALRDALLGQPVR
jgi:hypothetical protein